MLFYLKLQKNIRKTYYKVVVTKYKKPLTIVETLGSIKLKKVKQTKIIKLNIKRLKFWLLNDIKVSYKMIKILIDLNFLPKPNLQQKKL